MGPIRKQYPWYEVMLVVAVALSVAACSSGGAGSASTAESSPPSKVTARASALTSTPSSYMAVFAAIDPRFNLPRGVAVDGSGNVYVADHCTIRKITSAGVVTTVAGTDGVCGYADGIGAAAQFYGPTGIAVDGSGNLYGVDYNRIRKITPDGVVTTVAGNGLPGYADGTGGAAQFYNPAGVAADALGNLYVADLGDCTIRKITADAVVTTFAGTAWVCGYADGTGAAPQFYFPYGVAVDGSGNVYVGDQQNNAIRKITPDGVVSTLAASYYPRGVAVDGSGNVYVADYSNNAIRKITADGIVSTLAASVWQPDWVAVDGLGNVYAAELSSSDIRKITPDGVNTLFAGQPGSRSGSTDGTVRHLVGPQGAAVDGTGNLYVADSSSNLIFKITAGGVVTTLAGTAGVAGSADGTGAAARFYGPWGIAVDGSGNVYVADYGNCAIRKITPDGVVTTIAGTAGVCGSADGTGAAAQFYYPYGVAVDGSGNVYVADLGNNTIRKITPDGVVTTIAGTAGVCGSADGTGAAAQFCGPTGIAVDRWGAVYVADSNNNTIRQIAPKGMVTTVAGTAGVAGSADGAGAAAQFFCPLGVAVDRSGYVYVADSWNSTIRKITPKGVVSTVVGIPGQRTNVPGPLPTSIAPPAGIAVDPATTGRILLTNTDGVMEVFF